MAKFDYEESAQDALDLIQEFGDDTAKLIEPSGALKDPLQPWLGVTDEPTEHATVIALDTITSRAKSYLPESLASKTIKTAYMEDVILTIEPQLGWQIKHNGELWVIEQIADLKPNTINVYYEMIVSR